MLKIKTILDEDFTNYKKPAMLIAFPTCDFKCEKDAGGCKMCQNTPLSLSPTIEVPITKVVERYASNTITSAIVCGGLEPMDSYEELFNLIKAFRDSDINDDIVIYTGYNLDEVEVKVKKLSIFKNIIIKFGRYIPNGCAVYDEVLGIKLASSNQYAKKIKED